MNIGKEIKEVEFEPIETPVHEPIKEPEPEPTKELEPAQ